MSSAVATPPPAPGAPLTKKALTADHPTWCPGCGDFAVLACFYRVLEKLQYPHEKIVTFAGIGCSSRFPYFVNTHGGHFIHGRALPFAAVRQARSYGLVEKTATRTGDLVDSWPSRSRGRLRTDRSLAGATAVRAAREQDHKARTQCQDNHQQDIDQDIHCESL